MAWVIRSQKAGSEYFAQTSPGAFGFAPVNRARATVFVSREAAQETLDVRDEQHPWAAGEYYVVQDPDHGDYVTSVIPAVARGILPTGSTERKGFPITSGVLDYFPAALAAVAAVSKAGNDQHNPGEPLHWARGKSMDHADCIGRHLLERGTIDPQDNLSHTGKLAWRALALLQEELEAAGAPRARGAY